MNTHPTRTWFRRFALAWTDPIWITFSALALYVALAARHRPLWPASSYPYYNYLADAFLHGRLFFRLVPEQTHDLVLFQGQYSMYWPPLPAVILMPFVALFGVQFSDILFTLAVALANVVLVNRVLRQAVRREVVALSETQRGLLVLFFALGTVHLTLAPYGRVWFTGQLVGFLCVALAYLAALSGHGWPAFALTGLALAAALLTRNNLLFAGLWPAVYLLRQHRAAGWRRLLTYTLAGVLPVLLALGLLAAYNWARFGHILDNGLAYHRMAQVFQDDYARYGYFSLHYVPTNLFYQYITYPLPMRADTFHGGSLFLLSPVFFAAFWGLAAGRPRWSAWTLLGTIFLINIPILLLMGTGWVQFGPRYLLDFHLPLLLLTAMGVRRWPTWLLAVLTGISILHYGIGTLLLGRVI